MMDLLDMSRLHRVRLRSETSIGKSARACEVLLSERSKEQAGNTVPESRPSLREGAFLRGAKGNVYSRPAPKCGIPNCDSAATRSLTRQIGFSTTKHSKAKQVSFLRVFRVFRSQPIRR